MAEAEDEKQEAPEQARRKKSQEEGGILETLRGAFSWLNPLPARLDVREEVRRDLTTDSLNVERSGTPEDQYPVGQAQVFIYREEGNGYYEIAEPPLSDREHEVYQDLLEDFFYSLRLEAAENPMDYVEGAIWDSAYELGLLDEVRDSFSKFMYYIKRNALGFGKLQVPMNDENIEEVSVSGHHDPLRVIHRKHTDVGWLESNITFGSEMEIRKYNERLAQRLGEALTAAAPVADATTDEGHRAALTFGDEVTFPGSTFTIRKHPQEPLTLAKLVQNHSLSALMAAYLWQTLEWKGYMNVIGPIGSGKTTLMNAVLGSINPSTKRITIEETPELKLPPENWQAFHTRTASFAMGEEYEVDLFDLVKAAMRHRPDYLAVGESRGREIKTLTHAAALGHGASSTFHADSPENAITRMRADPMNLSNGELLLIWSLALTKRITLHSGAGGVVRRVHTIKEVTQGEEEEELELDEIFSYDRRTDSFEPDSIEEVVERTERLETGAELHGIGREGLIQKLEEKRDLLQDITGEETQFDQYMQRIREYYSEVGYGA